MSGMLWPQNVGLLCLESHWDATPTTSDISELSSSSSDSDSSSTSGSRSPGYLLRLALSGGRTCLFSSDTDESQRYRHTIREDTWRAHQLSKPEPSSGGGLLWDTVCVCARWRVAFHATNQFHGKVGGNSGGFTVPSSVPSEATGSGGDGKEDAERKSRTLPQDPRIPRKAEWGLPQPQHLRPSAR